MRQDPGAQARSQIGQSQHDLPARLSYHSGSKPSSPMTTVRTARRDDLRRVSSWPVTYATGGRRRTTSRERVPERHVASNRMCLRAGSYGVRRVARTEDLLLERCTPLPHSAAGIRAIGATRGGWYMSCLMLMPTASAWCWLSEGSGRARPPRLPSGPPADRTRDPDRGPRCIARAWATCGPADLCGTSRGT